MKVGEMYNKKDGALWCNINESVEGYKLQC